jgi:ABC-type ATPase involved in cell division
MESTTPGYEVKLEARNYNLFYGEFQALRDVNIQIPVNQITATIGPSGCGKSTFLRTFNRMNDLIPGVSVDGEVFMDDRALFQMDVVDLRRCVGTVFQRPNPFPKSIFDNAAYGARVNGVRDRARLGEIVERSLRDAALWDEVKDDLDKSGLALSGGQQQRLCIASKLLGIQADDSASLRVGLLRALDSIADRFTEDGRWLEEPPEPEPIVRHGLEPTTVTRTVAGTQFTETMSAAEMRETIEAASRTAVVWTPQDTEDVYETDSPWPTWLAADQTRSYRSPYQDDRAWPDAVTQGLWLEALEAWAWVDDVELALAALAGEDVYLGAAEEAVLEMMDTLAEALADVPDGSAQRVAGALAFRVKDLHRLADRQALYEAFCEHFGVDGTGGWEPELPSADGLRSAIETWVEKVAAKRGVWPSQAAAIRALALHGASPREAKAAAQAAYSRRSMAATEEVAYG